jgi:hypothetical protein
MPQHSSSTGLASVRRYFPVILMFLCAFRAAGQDIQPPDLWDIATGEQIPGAKVEKSMEFGAIVAGVDRRSSERGDVEPGDIILGVDGMRTYGWREFQLARFRNPMSSTMTLLVNHQGDLKWVKLHDLTAGRDVGIFLDANLEMDRFLNAAESLGVVLEGDQVRAALRLLPPHAGAALSFWAAANKTPAPADIAWIQDFVSLYSAVQRRHYADAKAPVHAPPIPYFQRLEKFYLGYAAANQPREIAPDLKKSGETPEFYTLALPVPDYIAPLGDLNLTDLRFKTLLTREHDTNGQADPEISTAAQTYASNSAGGIDQYLDQVRATMLDPDGQGGWPYRSPMIRDSLSRTLIVQQLADRMKDRTSPDWVIDAFAMVYIDLVNGQPQPAADAIADLGKTSPWLARRAAKESFAGFPRFYVRGKMAHMNPIRDVLAKNNDFLGDGVPELYSWATDKVRPLADKTEELWGDPTPAPSDVLVGAPYAVMLAVEGKTAPVVDAAPTVSSQNNKPTAPAPVDSSL